jgi:phenylacetate-CoA ligase
MKNEKNTKDEIIKIRDAKFRKILKFAYSNSPFYRDLYASHGIKSGDLDEVPIEKLPSTEKKVMIENFEQIITAKDINVKDALAFVHENKDASQLYQKKYKIMRSSGSSGTPAVTIYSINEMAAAISSNSRIFTIEFGKKYKFAYYAAVSGRFAGISYASLCKMGIVKYSYSFKAIDMNESLESVVKTLNEFQPDMLSGYGSGLAMLAKSQMDGKLKIKPNLVMSGGEQLFPQDAKLMKDAFGAPVIDSYGASECPCIGIGKEEYDGIYLMDDYSYIEIMEDHILVTNLQNFTQPIIRYRLDDRLTLKEDSKKLLPFRLIEKAVGRNDILVWFKNEKNETESIHPLVFMTIYIKGVEKYQIVLTSETSFDFLIVLADGVNEEECIREAQLNLDNILRTKGMSNVAYKVRRVDYPMKDKVSQKYKMVIKDF